MNSDTEWRDLYFHLNALGQEVVRVWMPDGHPVAYQFRGRAGELVTSTDVEYLVRKESVTHVRNARISQVS